MTEQLILSELHLLPEKLKVEVLHYVRFLVQSSTVETPIKKKTPKFGSAKGKYTMSADFNEPLDDFKDYM